MTDSSFRWPAEWEPQDAVLVAWPHDGTDWAANLADVERTYVELVAAIARFETAIVCVASAEIEATARHQLALVGVPPGRVRFVRVEYDDTWLRDTGPITLINRAAADGGASDAPRFRILDFRFTGWGGKFGADRDDVLVERLFEMGVFAAERQRVDWALEGGGIEGDGDDTVLSTTRCLRQRHPFASHTELQEILSRHLEVGHVHLLEYGALEGDDTDAHIDTLARFAAPDHIVYQACDDEGDTHHVELARMAEELAALKRPDGSSYRLTALPWAKPIHDADGRRLAASYANFLIVNDALLMPAYGNAADDARAAAVLAAAFPGRTIVPVDCRSLIEQNGSLHCVTMQLPRGVVA